MKKITDILLATIIVLLAATLHVSAQSEEIRKVSNFNSIESQGPFDVILTIDTTESVTITGSSDNIKLIETVVKGGALRIKYKDDLQPGQGNGFVQVLVTAKSLSSIVKNGAGSVSVLGRLVANQFSVALTGSGNVLASVDSKNLQVAIDGPGTITLYGTSDEAKVTIIGPGKLQGDDLETKNASAMINGAGRVYIMAENSISANITGAGKLVFAGNAVVGKSETAGSGGINKIVRVD